ncbi:substrate-binding periplasmic protein [Agaribacter marinus]|uniref:Solute-binding protein family 3/N-terminal domain-containing protein n=1 Tax=Agaribacter marinus TaxID=1431249 RepID=A0AA37WJ62_9ALTE|nr:transporter substrate-binding domain-containing protein [Agaribacter marinus]GLR72781.1 hypothetical protein GCM10007852_36890 [Agaribacter marinus]
MRIKLLIWQLYSPVRAVILILVMLCPPFVSKADTAPLAAAARHRPPWITVDKSGINGPLYEIANEAAIRAGITLKWRREPFARTLNALSLGNDILLPRMAKNEERAGYTSFTVSVLDIEREVIFAVSTRKLIDINSYADLEGKLIGVKRSGSYFKTFDEDERLFKVIVKDDIQLVKMLDAGRFEVAATPDRVSFEEAATKNNATRWKYAKYKHTFPTGIYFGLKKGSSYYLPFNLALIDMQKDGSIAAIFQKYGINTCLENTFLLMCE